MLKVFWFSTRTLPVAVEQHAARRRQRQLPEVVVLRHLAELLVLRDLEDPEPHGERRKRDRHDVLQDRQPERQAAAIVRHQGGRRHRSDTFYEPTTSAASRRAATISGPRSTSRNAVIADRAVDQRLNHRRRELEADASRLDQRVQRLEAQLVHERRADEHHEPRHRRATR